MNLVNKVFVFSEKPSALAELCNGGHQLGETVAAIVIGPQEDVNKAIKAGADQVFYLGEPDQDGMFEDYTLTIAQLLKKEQPDLLLIRATQRAKLIAGRLSAILGTSVLTDILEISKQADGIQGTRRMYGGAALRLDVSLSPTTIATVGAGTFEATAEDTALQGTVTSVDFIKPDVKIKCIERRQKVGESVNLNAAKRVVSVGRGIEKQENIKMVEELARVMEAEVGCTRPVAEGEKWLARERYIGVSGVMIKPDLYLSLGVSGQIQHMVGVNQARVILAVNKDKNAPIFKQADYGIVGDVQKVVPALVAKFKANQG